MSEGPLFDDNPYHWESVEVEVGAVLRDAAKRTKIILALSEFPVEIRWPTSEEEIKLTIWVWGKTPEGRRRTIDRVSYRLGIVRELRHAA